MAEQQVRTAQARARAALSSAGWREKAGLLAERVELAVHPSRVGLADDALGSAFGAISQLMLRMREMNPAARAPFFETSCRDLGVPSVAEAQQVWLGLLAWAEAHPTRAQLLSRLQHAYLESNRSWAQFSGGTLRPALMARALFYARQASWRDAARQAANGLTGDPRGQSLREDLFLWMGGLVEWCRAPGDRPGYLTTGDMTGPLLAALGLPQGEEVCLEGVLTAAGLPGPDPWDARLVRAAGLTMVSADHLLELVRHLRAHPDRAVALHAWEAELGPAAEVLERPWAREALSAAAVRLAEVIERHGPAARNAQDLEDFEARVTAAEGRTFRLADHFAAADVLYAWASLRDFARSAEEVPVSEPGAGFGRSPASEAKGGAGRSPASIPGSSGEGSTHNEARAHIESDDPDPEVVAEALTAAWRYGRRLLGRNLRQGYRVLLPLVDRHWNELCAGFLDLITRHPPDGELGMVVDVLAAAGRGAAVADSLIQVLARQRHAGRWPVVLEALLARLDEESLRALLPRASAVVEDRARELGSLVPGLVEQFVRAGLTGAGLDFCLRVFGVDARGGAVPLVEAAGLARAIGDWHSAGKPVLDAARALGELVPAAWQQLLDLCTEAGRMPEALALLLAWASRSTTPSGREKTREQLTEEWSWTLRIAARIPNWTDGLGRVWTAAEDFSCPIPAVWRTLVHEARARELSWIVREGSKRFVESWGADPAITSGLWDTLDRAVQAPGGETAEVVDLLHWLHVDLGHNRWTPEADFSHRVLALPGVTPRVLGEWAVRKLYSSRRWALLGAALAHDTDALDTLLDVVREQGHPISRALEGLVHGLPESRSWPFLIRLLPGPAWSIEWAWMEVLKRWKLEPAQRSEDLRALLPVMPEPQGPVTPAFERECRLLLGYLLASEPPGSWPDVARAFTRTAAGEPDGGGRARARGASEGPGRSPGFREARSPASAELSWTELVADLVSGPRGPQLYEAMIAELVEPLEGEPVIGGQARVLRERLVGMAQA